MSMQNLFSPTHNQPLQSLPTGNRLGGVGAKSSHVGQLKNSWNDSPNKSTFLGRKSPARDKSTFLGRKSPARGFKLSNKSSGDVVDTAGSPNSSPHQDDEKPDAANESVDCCQGIRRTVKRPNCAGGVRRGSNELLASHAHVKINTAQDLVVGELVVCGVFHALLSSFT